MIKNYIKKFDLNNKLAFVIGGAGYIGSEIVNALNSMNCKVINLDVVPIKKRLNKKIINEYINLSKVSGLEASLKKLKNTVFQIYL